MRELPPGTTPCRPDGSLDLAATGFCRSAFGPVSMPSRAWRKKRWDYWCITHAGGALAFVIADVDYVGLAAVTYFDFATRTEVERAYAAPMAVGVHLSDAPGAPASLRARWLDLSISHDADGTRLRAHGRAPWGPTIDAAVWVEPAGETLNIAVPMGGDAFQINAKHAARRARGDVRVGDRVIQLGDDAFAAADWGRGVWPRATRWNWACASGDTGGRTVGVNLGGAWTDGSGVTENALTIDGELHVISEDLRWDYDRRDFAAPWRIRDRAGKVDVRVEPFWPISKGADLGVLRSQLNLVWARFHGVVEADDGARVELEGLLGWAEEHVARW